MAFLNPDLTFTFCVYGTVKVGILQEVGTLTGSTEIQSGGWLYRHYNKEKFCSVSVIEVKVKRIKAIDSL